MNRPTYRTAIAALFATLCCSAAWAAYLKTDYEDTGIRERGPERPPDIVRYVPPPSVENPTVDLLRRVEVGAPCRHLGLTVFPLLLSHGSAAHGIRTLDEALGRGWITISERDDAQISEVHVRNDSSEMVLLMTGEIISGGRQNRVIREDVLLPPRSGYIGIPVYCVEQERWSGRSDRFESPASLVHQDIRKSAVAGGSQDDVWREVDAKAERAGVTSSTRNYQDIYENKRVGGQVDECVARFRGFCRRDTVGAVAVVGNRIVSCDVFSDPALFARLWSKLIRSCALEEVSPRVDRALYPGRRTGLDAGDIRRFLDRAVNADYRQTHTPGAGRALTISGGASGTAIVWDGEAVHLAVFPGMEILPMIYKNELEAEERR